MTSRDPDPLTSMYREAQQALRGLDLPASFTVEQLRRAVEQARARRITLVPQAMPLNSPCGVWIGTATEDYVFFDNTSGPAHRTVCIAHEFGHMLFDDPPTGGLADIAPLLLPDLDLSAIAQLKARSTFDDHRERRAEIFGTLVAQRSSSWQTPGSLTTDPSVLGRIAATLEAGRQTDRPTDPETDNPTVQGTP